MVVGYFPISPPPFLRPARRLSFAACTASRYPPYGVVYNSPQSEKMIEPTDTLKRMLDLSQMTLTAARLLPFRLGMEDNPPSSWKIISQYLQGEITELPGDITGLRQYALFDFFHQGLRCLEAITLLTPMPYQVRNATALGRLSMELCTNAAWIDKDETPQQGARVLSWLEWQCFMFARCKNRPSGESDIKAHEKKETEERHRLEVTHEKENCFHRGIKQRSKDIGKELPLKHAIMYRAYSLVAHGELPTRQQLVNPEFVLLQAVSDCRHLAGFLSGAFENVKLFERIWHPINERIKKEEDLL